MSNSNPSNKQVVGRVIFAVTVTSAAHIATTWVCEKMSERMEATRNLVQAETELDMAAYSAGYEEGRAFWEALKNSSSRDYNALEDKYLTLRDEFCELDGKWRATIRREEKLQDVVSSVRTTNDRLEDENKQLLEETRNLQDSLVAESSDITTIANTHRVEVTTFERDGLPWSQAVCTCFWEGSHTTSSYEAAAEAGEHERTAKNR